MNTTPQASDKCIDIQNLSVRYGDIVAVSDISFGIRSGEMVTLLGPSGCGKTTTLRSIAGLEEPFKGSIRLNGVTVYSSSERRNIPSERRGLSMVFQSYAIWPHMTVEENVAYGLKVRKAPRADIVANVRRALDLVQMTKYSGRSASKLSGGQQQRVAVARAIAFSPNVLLFDEPLSNLDAKLRTEMRVELRELQTRLGITSLYVTHDQEEALAISDRVIVMNNGNIEQIGSPEAIYNRPSSRFVAEFVGAANIIPGEVQASGSEPSIVLFQVKHGPLIKAASSAHSNPQAIALRSAYIKLETSISENIREAELNCVEGTIHRRMFHGDFIQYVVDWPSGQLIVRRPPTETIPEGSAVHIVFAPEHCVLV
jgi:iron(III) transport system ATP-binding protein